MGVRTPAHPSILPAPFAKVQLGLRVLSLMSCIAALVLFIVLTAKTHYSRAMSFFTVAWVILIDIIDIVGISASVRRLGRSPPRALLIIDIVACIFIATAIVRLVLFESGWYDDSYAACGLSVCIYDGVSEEYKTMQFAALALLGVVGLVHLVFVGIDIKEMVTSSRARKAAAAANVEAAQVPIMYTPQQPIQHQQGPVQYV